VFDGDAICKPLEQKPSQNPTSVYRGSKHPKL